MTTRFRTLLLSLSLIAAACGISPAMAQTERASSSAPACDQACSTQMRSTASSSSRSLQASPDDVTALSSAAKSRDMDQVRAVLQKHGFTAAQLEGFEIVVNEVKSPRDAATGQASGKRMHSSSDTGAGTGTGDPAALGKVKVTITVSIKPPKLIITISW